MDEIDIIEEKVEINNKVDNNDINEDINENLLEEKENNEKMNLKKPKEYIKETLLNNNDDYNKDIQEENISNNINNKNENKIITDYIITIQYTKLLKIPYFIFADIIHFYFSCQKFNEKEIKLSEISTPPFAVITKECK